jgi:serine protease
MRRIFLLASLFVIALSLILFTFPGRANQGQFKTIILDFKQDIPVQRLQKDLEAISQQFDVEPTLDNKFSEKDRVYIVKGDGQLLNSLRGEFGKETEFIEPNYIYKLPKPRTVAREAEYWEDLRKPTPHNLQDAPNDPYFSKQWNMQNIGVLGAWKETRGKGVTVAVIDTGISRVRDLAETKFAKGYDFVNDRENASDDNGHGTHVAGTIAQATNNSWGVVGIAYEATLMPLKVLAESGDGTVADIAEAIKFAADNGADVINMSLGGSGESQLMKKAIGYAHKKGVVIIASAGNENRNGASYPARYPHVIGVSATAPNNEKAPYSNYGAGVDISAPGGSEAGKILQETIDAENKSEPVFLGLQGTSMASPHVAGVAALIKALGVSNPTEVLDILKNSARPIADDKLNYFGAGHLNAEAAVKKAVQGQISFTDFFRWLRDNGYLNIRFWIDGGAIALLPKVLMVVGSYLLAWILRIYLPQGWNWFFAGGVVMGSTGLFPLRGFYIFDLPQWPFRLLGTSIPELGNIVQGTDAFNPLFASVLAPLALMGLLLGHAQWKWFAIGATLGITSCLTISSVIDPAVWGLGADIISRLFLIGNAALCFGLAHLAAQGQDHSTVRT